MKTPPTVCSFPRFSAYDYRCFSAADTQDQIAPMGKEDILIVVEDLVQNNNVAVEDIKDAGYLVYSVNAEYKDFDSGLWLMLI